MRCLCARQWGFSVPPPRENLPHDPPDHERRDERDESEQSGSRRRHLYLLGDASAPSTRLPDTARVYPKVRRGQGTTVGDPFLSAVAGGKICVRWLIWRWRVALGTRLGALSWRCGGGRISLLAPPPDSYPQFCRLGERTYRSTAHTTRRPQQRPHHHATTRTPHAHSSIIATALVAPPRRSATPLCKKTRGGKINAKIER